ncbi:hypothetical protein DCAR_0206899 [Daucus carota subsp. sativus]|uniref:Uncharacterized protein n=1 Tax=Daucus carota subsp. sativus TaxID=79200 RepID=A0A166DI64_DAUCS|nr:PREDICTED: zinc finger protein ZAT5-like [Daucus carota subsp. sativus]WOG87668.1 hypothetical protein DCAR_0206899 [Daucus carota subsp. sativus]
MRPIDGDHIIRGKRTKRSRQSSSSSSLESLREDEDLAKCLIMLARSGSLEKPNSRVEKAEFCFYECKTCKKCFSSFQALGGHRASHKKPKTGDKHVGMTSDFEDVENAVSGVVSVGDVKAKVHECLVCGSEFGSGQALGGHMRRHRSNNTTTTADSATKMMSIDGKVRNVLELDLNLPAPEDQHMDSRFIFSYPCQAPTLIDCQY